MQILQELKGHPWDGTSEKLVLSLAEDSPVRVVKKHDMMSFEFVEGRVTVFLEDDGTVWDVQREVGILYREY